MKRVRIYLPPGRVDFAKEITILLNGRRRFHGTVEPSWQYALESSHKRRDRREIFMGQIDLDVR